MPPGENPLLRAPLSRRRFLALGGGLAATATLGAACSSQSQAAPPPRVGPHSPAVTAAAQARQVPGAPTVNVALEAAPTEIDLGAGTRVSTWAFGGQLPGKEIRTKKGDVLRVDLRNNLPQDTTIHWHGLAIRNDMDGVPALTQDPIKAGADFRYEFTLPESGTFWFHPHVGMQLDRGLYAPLIIEDPAEPGKYDTEVVVVLDDWIDGTGTNPDAVLANLNQQGMNMGAGMGMGGGGGMSGMGMSGKGPLGGDAGDVTYPYYLANGKIAAAPQVVDAKPGQRIRLRLINAGADTAFRVGMPTSAMTITHTDGFPVTPQQAQAVIMGMGERVDAIITVPDTTTPLLVIPEGKNGIAQLVIRVNQGAAPDPRTLVPAFLQRPVLDTAATRATKQVFLPTKKLDVTHDLVLKGPGPGAAGKYTWTINGKTYNPAEGLPVRQGQRARLRFINQSMMYHPMHLHGHTFQVRGQGGSGPRKDTVLVLPMQTVEVDFDADNPGQWLTHCHNIYHGESGMMTVTSYVE